MTFARRAWRISAITFIVALVGATSYSAYRVSHPLPWDSAALCEAMLERLPGFGAESFRFTSNGLAITYITSPDGGVAAPVVYWRIVGKQLVITEEPEGGPPPRVFTLLFATRHLLVVHRASGGIVCFQRVPL